MQSGHWRHSEQASGSEGEDTSLQIALCFQELEAGACHHGKAEQPNNFPPCAGSSLSAMIIDVVHDH